ncbi:MAG TPA: helix-turn-helix transcriptional regulator [Candidatus Binatia bacterium]
MNFPAIQRALGQIVRDRRQSLGLSQETFAERCGLHRTYVGSVERGERNVTLTNMDRIAKALGATLTEILSDAEKAVAKSKR